MDIQIQQKTIVTEKNINSIGIKVTDYILNEKAKITVFLNEGGVIVDVQEVIIEGEEFSNWGSDDNYIINLILDKFGLDKVN